MSEDEHSVGRKGENQAIISAMPNAVPAAIERAIAANPLYDRSLRWKYGEEIGDISVLEIKELRLSQSGRLSGRTSANSIVCTRIEDVAGCYRADGLDVVIESAERDFVRFLIVDDGFGGTMPMIELELSSANYGQLYLSMRLIQSLKPSDRSKVHPLQTIIEFKLQRLLFGTSSGPVLGFRHK